MSLITRCSACGTMFKVVADQLRISQGWVRCGHCSEVFDAAANLQPYVSPGVAAGPMSPAPGLAQIRNAAAPADAVSADAVSPMLVAPSAEPEPIEPAARPEPAPQAQPEPGPTAAALSLPEMQVSPSPDIAADVFAFSVSPQPSDFSEATAPDRAPFADSSEESSLLSGSEDLQEEVSFVRNARREAFWRRPAVRGALGLTALALLAGLLLQMALFQRSTLVLSQPWLSPGLHTLCAYLHCTIAPPQQIESVVIDSSSFTKLAPDAYQLKVVIKNAGAIALALPSLELTLTDTQDQALLRRVLSPAELGAQAQTLAAGAGFSGSVSIQISSASPEGGVSPPASVSPPSVIQRIAGYRVLAFYP